MLSLHVAVALFGLAGLFSKFLSVSPVVIVWGRTSFAVAAIAAFLLVRRERVALLNRSDGVLLLAQGAILAFHWFAFFQSIRVSSVAVGLLAFSSFPIFVLFLEWLFRRQPVRALDLVLGCTVIAGLAVLVPDFDAGSSAIRGLSWGAVSSFTFAVLTLLNRRLSGRYPPVHIAFAQNLTAALVLTPFAAGKLGRISANDWILLAVLGVFCTALSHSLFIHSLSRVRAFVASIVASLEPAYGILAALLLLGEIPAPREVVGGIIVLCAAIALSLKETTGTQEDPLPACRK